MLAALGTGIQLLFLGSLIPILLIFLILILILKKRESIKTILLIFFIFLIFFYFILILFWVDAHSNIILQPYNFFIKTFSMEIDLAPLVY